MRKRLFTWLILVCNIHSLSFSSIIRNQFWFVISIMLNEYMKHYWRMAWERKRDARLIKLQTQAVGQNMPSKSVVQIKFSNPNLTCQELNLLWHTELLSPCPSWFLLYLWQSNYKPVTLLRRVKSWLFGHACICNTRRKTFPQALCKLHWLWLKLRLQL